ncbi:TPA: hypothetical protein ACGCGJ_000397 [Stenotrophomonas maltophilia]|uniref:hypothetical protein n=1 Tax=Stenotrophomonas maltophilia TaxID=40324 RepID=UPI000DA79C41|nr:hypothetical protein [Stenotrophomonas maltophilia]PZS96323.1 hypothetical protein A7X66_09145 [Stenotrophomonas maltophilia]
MATYSREELVRQVLLRLGVLDADEAPEARDAADVGRMAQTVMEDLYAEGKLPFDIEGNIPARYLTHLSYIIAEPLVADYGALAREATIARHADTGRKAINRLNASTYQGAVVPSDYF